MAFSNYDTEAVTANDMKEIMNNVIVKKKDNDGWTVTLNAKELFAFKSLDEAQAFAETLRSRLNAQRIELVAS